MIHLFVLHKTLSQQNSFLITQIIKACLIKKDLKDSGMPTCIMTICPWSLFLDNAHFLTMFFVDDS